MADTNTPNLNLILQELDPEDEWGGKNNQNFSTLDTEIVAISGAIQGDLDTHEADGTIHFTVGSIDHGSVSGLADDDHILYTLTDGTRGFSSTVSGVDPVDSDDLATKNYVDTEVANKEVGKNMMIESINGSENLFFFYIGEAKTVGSLIATISGETDPGITWTVRRDSTRNGIGTEVITGGTNTHNGNSGEVITSFDSANIAANSFVWVETTSISGTIDEFGLTLL